MSEVNARQYSALFGETTNNAEMFLKRFIETLPVILFVFQPDADKLLYVNEKFSKVLGYKLEDVNIRDNMLPNLMQIDNVSLPDQLFEKPSDTTQWYNYKGNFVSKDGHSHRVDISGIHIEQFMDTTASTILFMGSEMSGPHSSPELNPMYKQALLQALNLNTLGSSEKDNWEELDKLIDYNQNLRNYHETFREAEKYMHYGYWEIDLVTNKIFWSEGVYFLFGYKTQEEINSINLTMETINQHLQKEFLDRYDAEWESIIREKNSYLREIEINTYDGKKKRLETFGKVFRDETGKAMKVCGITRENTKLREFESALEVKINELSRSNKELEDFAFMASHDLQEPLRKLSSFGEKLQDSAKEMLNDEQNNYLGRMLKATENMKHLIDSLLNFSLITQNEKKYEKVDLNLILKQVLTEQELKIEETKATIELDELPTIEAVSSQMKQLFNNLLHNALKFSSKNQQPVIRITSKQVSKKEIQDSGLLYNMNYYKIVLTDNGIGIDPRETEQIFQIFKRLHAKFEYSGSGIGLAICRKIIDYHKGIIYAESSIGKGAAFSILIPERQITYASF